MAILGEPIGAIILAYFFAWRNDNCFSASGGMIVMISVMIS